jgi:hypothetical protein
MPLENATTHACVQDSADELAAKLFAALLNQLHDRGVSWGPDPDKVHLLFCQTRERLAREIRDRDAATKQGTISEIRTRLCG